MSGETLTLGEADAGQTVRVRPGDRIQLRLAETPTTGFRWSGEAPVGLRLARDTFVQVGSAPGAGGQRELDYVAEAPGTVELVLRCERAWEGPDAAIGTFRLGIEVR
jgi:inhibitor of cysteine peptidase